MIKVISGLPEGYQGQDVKDFLAIMEQAVLLLDTLGQIQAAVGGLSMASRAHDTFECHARLQNYVRQFKTKTN